MFAQVKTWGNSQEIQLSKELLALAGIEKNDFLDIELISCRQQKFLFFLQKSSHYAIQRNRRSQEL